MFICLKRFILILNITFLEVNNRGTCSEQFIMFLYIERCLHESRGNTLRLSSVNPRKGRSSRSLIFFKIGVFKSFANFTQKHLCWGLFLIKFRFLKISFFTEYLRWLLLEGVREGTRLVKILQSCHFNIFGISRRCFRKMPIKRNSE